MATLTITHADGRKTVIEFEAEDAWDLDNTIYGALEAMSEGEVDSILVQR